MPDGTQSTGFDGAEILVAQRAAFLAEGAPDLAQRRASLDMLASAIRRNSRRLEEAANRDFGRRSSIETGIVELAPTLLSIKYMRRKLRRWMAPERRPVPLVLHPGRARVQYQPLGVVGIMAPWNYPISLTLEPLAAALAAGNRAMIKPSELAPATAEAIGNMLAEIFPPEQVAVVTGGPEVAAAFSALPFDHLFFTGSTAIGRHVMRAAAENLTPVTLELGGKSPVILLPDADLDRAAGDLAFGKATNAGQTCIAPDYLLAHPDQIDRLSDAFVKAVRDSYPGGRADPGLTTIIGEKHLARLADLVEDARARGARLVEPFETTDSTGQDRSVAPALMLGATPDMRIMKEEIFGPILPVMAIDTIEEAISFVNARPRPLALYVYGRDRTFIDDVLSRTISGNVTVNGAMLHYAVDSLPFGGVGDSGIGSYHGIEGFRRLSHAKGVFLPEKHHGTRLLRPPYGRLARLAMRYLLR